MPSRSQEGHEVIADWEDRQRRWAAGFKVAYEAAGHSQASVAHAVGLAPRTIANYVLVRTRLDPAFLVPIANVVGASAVEWAMTLGFVSDRLLTAGRALEDTRRGLREATRQLAVFAADGGTTAHLIQAVLDTGSWTVAADPWFEGPSACRLRVGDLLTLERTDGGPFRAADLRADARVGPALTAAGAVRTPVSVWTDEEAPGADPQRDVRRQWMWAVPRLNVTRSRADVPSRVGVRTIGILSPHSSTWGVDVASLVATALGYGATSTSGLSRFALGDC